MITDIFLGIFLMICSVTDIRSKELKPAVLILFGAAGLILYYLFRPVSLFEEMAGIIIGLFFIGLYLLTDEKIGLGDGLLITVTGIYLGGRENALLIMTAMVLSAVFSIILLLSKKAGRKTKFAFVPFVFLSFIIQLILRRFS